ncbi:histidine triad nucleotide-binding protein [bacterium]|nr:histidine triad nucleotide-binding protein [bacterium]
MKKCLFCQIIAKKIPANIFYEDEKFIVFYDINPIAPLHLLLVPKVHIPSINDLKAKDKELIGELFLLASKIAKKQGIKSKGYRLIFNVGKEGGQAIKHLHLHLLGGKTLPWSKY